MARATLRLSQSATVDGAHRVEAVLSGVDVPVTAASEFRFALSAEDRERVRWYWRTSGVSARSSPGGGGRGGGRHSEDTGDRYGAGQTRLNVALALRRAGRTGDALLYAHAALRDFHTLGHTAADMIERTQGLIAAFGQDTPTG